ncbi:hypothetical protein Tco_0383396 [Tanacetum coccineum]
MDFLVAHVHNLGKSLLGSFADKIDLVVPRMVANALEERLPKFLDDTLKAQLPHVFTNLVRETLLRFNRRIRNALHDEMLGILKTSVSKPLNKEFNALTNWNFRDMQPLRNQFENLFTRMEPQPTTSSDGQDTLALVVQSTDEQHEEPPTKRLKVVTDIPTILTPVPLNSFKPTIVDNIPFEQFSATEEGPMTIEEAQLQLQEAKRRVDLKAAKDKSEAKLKRLTPTQLKAQAQVLTEIKSERAQHLNKMIDEYC